MSRVTAPSLRELKRGGDKIAVLTAYDYPSAKLLDDCGIDAILVGDSVGMAVLGRTDTLGVTMDEMIYHTRQVSSAVERALVIADMPFMSYQVSPEDAVRNAGRLISEGGAHAVKLEGPPEIFEPVIRKILDASIPVMGHLGLTPQSIHKLGGYKVQGKDAASRAQLTQAAKDLDALGCCGVVLECVPAPLAEEITNGIACPTIGIGAGDRCDGQVLVMHDILGWGFTKFTKTFVDIKSQMGDAFKGYIDEVKGGTFPTAEHEYQ